MWRILVLMLLACVTHAQIPPLNEDNILIMEWAATMANAAIDRTQAESMQPFHPDFFAYIESKTDGVLMGYRYDRCFVSFQPNQSRLVDMWQLFNPFKAKVCQRNDSNQCCKTRSGFHDAYFKQDYYEEYVEKVEECRSLCSNPNECVIFTGSSQGAASAAVAGIDLIDLNPRVYQFSSVDALDDKCDAIDEERYLVIVNTGVCTLFHHDYYLYDDPNEIALKRGVLRGHVLHMSEDPGALLNRGLNAPRTKQTAWLRFYNFRIHFRPFRETCPRVPAKDEQLQRIREYHQSGGSPDDPVSFPVRDNGWRTGFPCNYGYECASGICEKAGLLKWRAGNCV